MSEAIPALGADTEPATALTVTSSIVQASPRKPGAHGGGLLSSVTDRESASALAQRRWDKRNRLAREALAAAGAQQDQLPAKPTHWDMTKLIYTQHAMAAADPDMRNSVSSAKLVLGAAYSEPERAQLAAGTGSQVTLTVSGPAAERLAALMAARLGQG